MDLAGQFWQKESALSIALRIGLDCPFDTVGIAKMYAHQALFQSVDVEEGVKSLKMRIFLFNGL